jgi:diguanylate cyclase
MDASKQPRIFVADQPVDDRAWSSVALHGLASVVQWESGEQLIGAVLENAIPDLVFLADLLPDRSGLEVCRRFMLDPATRDIPVILLSEAPDEDFVRAALQAGAADVLSKPLNPDLLRARIRTYLALSRQAQALCVEAQAQARSEELERMVHSMRTELHDRERTMARAEFLFNHDLITGLPNRRHLLEMMERARRRAESDRLPMAVIALGIEHYAALQASMDQEQFDRMLAAAALCMQRTLRPLDFVARISEDLFAAVLVPRQMDTPEIAAHQAREIAERAGAALNSEIVLDGRNVSLEVRSAIAVYPQDGESARDLLKHLDQTLAITRNGGVRERRRSTTPDLATSLALELRLRQALENERLVPYYQPKVDSRSGALVGGETLIRWPLRSGEYVGPGEFVPIAEAGGLIPALDDYVLTAACVQIAQWQDRFHDFRIGVNLSALKLHRRGVFDRLRELFALTRARPQHLELEITESALITDFDAAASWLTAVRQMGVSVALDDFGTGYSSLAYLRRLPLDAIKIDQSFVEGLADERSTLPIVRAMISMAKALDMRVVAEGVENEDQARVLTQLGCDSLQGFLYSPAVPAPHFELMLAAGRVLLPRAVPDPGVRARASAPSAAGDPL